MAPIYNDFELQASPRALELLGGWDGVQSVANEITQTWPHDKFYPVPFQDEKVEVITLVWKGLTIVVLPYIDEKGIRVLSFDPARDLHGIREGHHRV